MDERRFGGVDPRRPLDRGVPEVQASREGPSVLPDRFLRPRSRVARETGAQFALAYIQGCVETRTSWLVGLQALDGRRSADHVHACLSWHGEGAGCGEGHSPPMEMSNLRFDIAPDFAICRPSRFDGQWAVPFPYLSTLAALP